MKESYQSSSKYILMFSLPVFIFLFVFASPMLLLFGSEFDNAFALKILLTGIFIQTIFGLGSSTLSMSGNTSINLINVSIALILNISVRGVEKSKYRLKKKLALNHDEGLVSYLAAI